MGAEVSLNSGSPALILRRYSSLAGPVAEACKWMLMGRAGRHIRWSGWMGSSFDFVSSQIMCFSWKTGDSYTPVERMSGDTR
jgi:hypothetical protein